MATGNSSQHTTTYFFSPYNYTPQLRNSWSASLCWNWRLPHVQWAVAHVSWPLRASLICITSWPWKRSLINATRITKSKRIGSFTDCSRKRDTTLHTCHFSSENFQATSYCLQRYHCKRSKYSLTMHCISCFGRAGSVHRQYRVKTSDIKSRSSRVAFAA
jgi:hypothetical protein